MPVPYKEKGKRREVEDVLLVSLSGNHLPKHPVQGHQSIQKTLFIFFTFGVIRIAGMDCNLGKAQAIIFYLPDNLAVVLILIRLCINNQRSIAGIGPKTRLTV